MKKEADKQERRKVVTVIVKKKSASNEMIEFLKDYVQEKNKEYKAQKEERRQMHNEKNGTI